MQAKLKVNTEQNQTRLSSLSVADCAATNALPADQLITNSSSPTAIASAGPQTRRSSVASCSGDVIAARHVRRAEEAWRAYTSQNRSVIVDTFQGQFKSTVSDFVSPGFLASLFCGNFLIMSLHQQQLQYCYTSILRPLHRVNLCWPAP